MRFSDFRHFLNAEPDLWSGSALPSNPELNFGPVLKSSGSNFGSEPDCGIAIPKKSASIITQLRTGHIPLAKYLYRIGRAVSPTCPVCLQYNETVHHFILRCPAFAIARQTLHQSLGNRAINIHRLFTKLKPMKALIKYVADTGRFARPSEVHLAAPLNHPGQT